MDRCVNYDHIAQTYDRRYEENQYTGIEQALLQFMDSPPGLQALEMGCGTGHWLGVLRERGVRVTGLDASTQMLVQAQVMVPGVQLIHGQAERLPWPAGSFDRVFCINAFHHFTDKAAFLAEARRVLRPGGMLMIVGLDPHSGSDQWCIYDYFEGTVEIDKQRYPSASSIREWMRIAGFEDCVTREVQYLYTQLPAREALEQGQLDKAVTSQLSVLTDEEYQRGIERIKTEIKRAEGRGQTLFLTADLRLYGTSGSVRSASR
jgi:ubiquinone/menaquinone biosynthesis C-methylase UbiE